MARLKFTLLLLGAIGALSSVLYAAEPTKTIVIKVFDGKTGRPLVPTGYQVRVNHEVMQHGDWVKQGDDGTAELTIPADTQDLSLHLAYDDSMEIYINCDKDKNAFGDVWYRVPEIMSKGMVTANGCGKAKVSEKYKTTAVPGELIMFVREKNMVERVKD